jgi:transcriptional regulator with XRE-family HTH domain
MPARDSITASGAARGRAALSTFTEGFRQARIGSGLTQRRVADVVGLSASEISRIENGKITRISHEMHGKLAAVVGLDLRLNLYASARRVRDEGQIRLLRAFRDRLGPDWRWRFEVPFPLAGDQRGWDMGGSHARTKLAIAVDGE